MYSDYNKIEDSFEREVYKDCYERFRNTYESEYLNFKDFQYNSIEEARIVRIHCDKFSNNKLKDDALTYLAESYKYFVYHNSDKYWKDISSDSLFETEEYNHLEELRQKRENEKIEINMYDVEESDILEVNISYVPFDGYPGNYINETIGCINIKDIDKLKEYVIKNYVSHELSGGGYNYSINVYPYKTPNMLEF